MRFTFRTAVVRTPPRGPDSIEIIGVPVDELGWDAVVPLDQVADAPFS